MPPLLLLSLLLLSAFLAASASSPPQDLQVKIQDATLTEDDLVSSSTWINSACCPTGLNAVCWAAKLGSKSLPLLLSKGGSAPLWHEETKTSPSPFAAREGFYHSLKALLDSLPPSDAALELEREDEHGNNVLHLASLSGQVAMVNLLRSYNKSSDKCVTPNQKQKQKQNPSSHHLRTGGW
jgi:ankyrin repeat protein